MLVRIMTEPRELRSTTSSSEIFSDDGVELVVEPRVFEQIAELAIEYKTGARSLRGIFEELITPILFVVPDNQEIQKVVITSLFSDPTITRRSEAVKAPVAS